MELKSVGFDSDNAEGIAHQLNRWFNNKTIEIISCQLTSDTYIHGSSAYVGGESRTHALLIYKEKEDK